MHVEIPEDCAIPDVFNSSNGQARTTQLRDALLDDDVRAVLASTGGWNAIDVLELLNMSALADVTPKILCGLSDITVLTTAFFAVLGWQTYYGPNFATFSEGPDPDYTMHSFSAAMMGPPTERVVIGESHQFGETSLVGSPSEKSYSCEDQGMRVLHPGVAEGTIFGGNLGTLFLLQGTRFWPTFRDNVVLFLEDDDLAGKFTLVEALRRLRSLLLQPTLADLVTGVVIGRFQKPALATVDLIERGLEEIPILRDVPIIINAPFGHTRPMLTIPIGGHAYLDTLGDDVSLALSCAVSNESVSSSAGRPVETGGL